MDQSNLLTVAEKVVLLFHKMVDKSTEDPAVAAQTLIELTLGINELAEEVNKGKAMLKQFEVLKNTLMSGLGDLAPEVQPTSGLDIMKVLNDAITQELEKK